MDTATGIPNTFSTNSNTEAVTNIVPSFDNAEFRAYSTCGHQNNTEWVYNDISTVPTISTADGLLYLIVVFHTTI